jgi:hypothetical protein
VVWEGRRREASPYPDHWHSLHMGWSIHGRFTSKPDDYVTAPLTLQSSAEGSENEFSPAKTRLLMAAIGSFRVWMMVSERASIGEPR